ncbi:MAG: hypothetical protein L7T24_12430, partial [Luminiphilus sp.]|nr:hypothetical protein [Luminiphilus sp.]
SFGHGRMATHEGAGPWTALMLHRFSFDQGENPGVALFRSQPLVPVRSKMQLDVRLRLIS